MIYLGIPAGVLNVVPCDRSNAASVGQLLCENPKVGVITFTGNIIILLSLFLSKIPMYTPTFNIFKHQIIWKSLSGYSNY